MFRNCVLNLRNVQIWAAPNCKRFYFSEGQEWYFQAAKRSNKGSTIVQDGRFPDAPESRFQASKRSNIGSAELLGRRSADVQEFCFQTA